MTYCRKSEENNGKVSRLYQLSRKEIQRMSLRVLSAVIWCMIPVFMGESTIAVELYLDFSFAVASY